MQPIVTTHNRTEGQAPAVLTLDFFQNIRSEPLSFAAVGRALDDPSVTRVQIIDEDGIRTSIHKTWIVADASCDDAHRDTVMKAARKAFGRTGRALRVTFGRGVLARDGVTPYAAGTMHEDGADGWRRPVVLSYVALGQMLADDTVAGIEVIGHDNARTTIVKRWIAVAPADILARAA